MPHCNPILTDYIVECPECGDELRDYMYDNEVYWCCQNIKCGHQELDEHAY